VDTDDDDVSLEDIIERYDEDQKEEKIEQTDQRVVNQTAYLDFAEKYQEAFLATFTKKTREELTESERKIIDKMKFSLENTKKDLNSVGRNEKIISELMPVIPMGKNTHAEDDRGFKAGKGTKNTITPASKKLIESNPLVAIQYEGVKTAWNSLPDEQRDLIGEFQVRASSTNKPYTAGSYEVQKKKLTITLHARQTNVKDVFNNLHHEIGHAQYHKLMETSPDKVKKFNETVQEAQKGGGITAYAESYRHAEEKATQRKESVMSDIDHHIAMSKKYPERWESMPDGYREKTEKTLTYNVELSKTIFQNETHSALAQLVTGTNTMKIQKEHKESLRSLFNAYKELHE